MKRSCLIVVVTDAKMTMPTSQKDWSTMARAHKPQPQPSHRFPQLLEIILEDGAEMPEMSRATELKLITLGTFGRRLQKARDKSKAWKRRADGLRDRILQDVPSSVYGVVVRRQQPVEIKVSTVHTEQPSDAAKMIKFLGPHASDIVTGVELPLSQLVSNQRRYKRFVKALQKEFGSEISEAIGVTINKEAFWKLVKEGKLPEPPENFFRREPTADRRVMVRLL